jgi:hypothetical protein
MPVRKQPKFTANDIVEAVHTFATHMPSIGTALVFREGERVRGDNEAVKQNPQFFALAGSPHEELDAQRRELYARDWSSAPAQVFTKIAPALRDEDAVVPCSLVIGVPEGKRMAKDDPAVKEQRDAFVPVVGDGLTRENSVVALTTMKHTGSDGTTRTVWQGQWVAKDDALVSLHPHSFGLLPPS